MSGKHIVIDARGRQSSSGRYVDRLIEHLQDIDRDNHYTVLLDPADPWQPSASNFQAESCKYKKFTFNLLEQFTFTSFLNDLEPDLVHFWMTPQEPLLYTGPRVTTTHDLTMLRFARAGQLPEWLHGIRMAGYRFLLKQSLKKADKVITPTRFVADDVAENYPFTRDKLVVTHEASEPPLAGKEQAPAHKLDEFILYVGTAFPHKNLQRLVDAFGALNEADPDLQLVLVGKKEQYYEELEDYIAEKPYANKIITAGFVSDLELKWYYTHAAAYVFPSLSEGFGLPGLEAMVHGCPVVSSNATCLPEVYGDAALYFDPLDPIDMAEKIAQVLVDTKLRRQLMERGRKQATKYSWRRMAEETLKVYKEIVED